MNSTRLVLRSWRVEDAEWYVQSRDEEIYRWTNEARGLTRQETEQAILQVNASETTHSFAIVERTTGEILGNIALVIEHTKKTTGEGHYWLCKNGRGQGYATEALQAVSEWGFRTLCLRSIRLHILAGNSQSRRVAERAGYILVEGSQENGWVWYERPDEGE